MAWTRVFPNSCIVELYQVRCVVKKQLKIPSDHDSTLFQTNDITLIHDKKFLHDFNAELIASIEAKQLKFSGELENLGKNEIFDGNYVSKKNQNKAVGNQRTENTNGLKTTSDECIISA